MSTDLLTGVEVASDAMVAVFTLDLEARARETIGSYTRRKLPPPTLGFSGVEAALRGVHRILDAAEILNEDLHVSLGLITGLSAFGTKGLTGRVSDFDDELLEKAAELGITPTPLARVAMYGEPAEVTGDSHAYRLQRISMQSPLAVVVELTPLYAVGMGSALLYLAHKIATFKSRTNAVNSRNELEAALNEKAKDQVFQGKVDALAVQLQRERDLLLPTDVEILDPTSDEDPEPPQLPPGPWQPPQGGPG